MRLIVCALDEVAEAVRASAPDRVVSLLAPAQPAPLIADRPHLRLALNDITVEAPGLTLAGLEVVKALLDFALAAPRPARLLLHCHFGVSRSPAAALVVACAVRPDVSEQVLARRLRAASPQATPNPRLVRLGDEHLGRRGRLVQAAAAIGRGADYVGPERFELDVATF